MQNFLDFEKPLLEIRTKIEELRHLKDDSKNIANELSSLQDKYDNALSEIYKNLTPWQKVKICRHQDRPKFFDYVNNIFEDFVILSGCQVSGVASTMMSCGALSSGSILRTFCA